MKKPSIVQDARSLPSGSAIVDTYEGSLRELFFIQNPQHNKNAFDDESVYEAFVKNANISDVYIYYESLNTAIRTVEEEAYFQLRTARNRNLILEAEQRKYRQMKIAVAGLSVGSAIVEAVVRSGGPKFLRIADFDTVELSNLNRIKASILDYGRKKTDVAAERIWKLDPFAELDLWHEGVSAESLSDFLDNKPGIDVFIDAMDSLDLKVAARFLCRDKKIPVVMVTDVGDGVIVDVERYDTDSNLAIFNGNVNEEHVANLAELSRMEWIQIAAKIVGKNQPSRMKQSVMEMGKTIAGLPQLGTSAMVAGAAVSFVLRKIANNQSMPSGRQYVSFEQLLDVDYNSPQSQQERELIDEQFNTLFTT